MELGHLWSKVCDMSWDFNKSFVSASCPTSTICWISMIFLLSYLGPTFENVPKISHPSIFKCCLWHVGSNLGRWEPKKLEWWCMCAVFLKPFAWDGLCMESLLLSTEARSENFILILDFDNIRKIPEGSGYRVRKERVNF